MCIVVWLQVSLNKTNTLGSEKIGIFFPEHLFILIYPTKLCFTSEYIQSSLYFEYFYGMIAQVMCVLKYTVFT